MVVASKSTPKARLARSSSRRSPPTDSRSTDKVGFGTTDVGRKAIAAEEPTSTPNTGNGEDFFHRHRFRPLEGREQGYQTVKKLDLEKVGIVWLDPARPTTRAIAVRKDLAVQSQLATLDDLAMYLSPATLSNWPQRGVHSQPPFRHSRRPTASLSRLQTCPCPVAAPPSPRRPPPRAPTASTPPWPMAPMASCGAGLVVLADTKGVKPIYEPAPILRKEVLGRYPAIDRLLDAVFAELDLVTLQTLNSRGASTANRPTPWPTSSLEGRGLAHTGQPHGSIGRSPPPDSGRSGLATPALAGPAFGFPGPVLPVRPRPDRGWHRLAPAAGQPARGPGTDAGLAGIGAFGCRPWSGRAPATVGLAPGAGPCWRPDRRRRIAGPWPGVRWPG